MRSFETVGVVGAGTMGAGIAQKLAQEGIAVVLVDLDEPKAQAGMKRLASSLDEAVARKIMDSARAESVRARVTPTSDWSRLAPCDLVIEAVFEDLAVKRDVFARLDASCREDAVLATNTSSFFVRDVAAATRFPRRVIGLHYFYHPAKNRLVEVVAHEESDRALVAEAWALQERIGKTPIASRDAPGFVVNRFFVPWLDEAARCLADGISIASVEAAAKDAFGIGMGPFELMNVTGIPIALHSAATLGRELGAGYAPSARLEAQVASGKLWELSGSASDDERARDRLLGTAILAAAELVESNVATIEDTDLGARVGLRWRRGPFELANELGLARALELVEAAAQKRNREVPKLIADRLEPAGQGPPSARASRPFALERVRLELDAPGGVPIATLTLDRPDAMNALDEAMVERLTARFDDVESRPEVKGVIIRGRGKAFVAGADVKFFVKNMEKGDLDAIVRFTEAGQQLFSRFAKSRLVVVAALEGLSLGGGSELALACDAIVATPRGSIGFPETGIGIYPGLGGTQRLPRRVGRGLARFMFFSGRTLSAEEALATGAIDRLVRSRDELLAAAREIIAAGKPPMKKRADATTFPMPLRLLAHAFDVPGDWALVGRVGLPDDPLVKKEIERIQRRAPRAIVIADELCRQAIETPLDEGLALELGRLREIFSTPDAREGLTALVEGRRAKFAPAPAGPQIPHAPHP